MIRPESNLLVRAAGGVNLIGEHADYNDSFLLPVATDRPVWIALRPSSNRQITVTSLDMGETAAFNLDDLQHDQSEWAETGWSGLSVVVPGVLAVERVGTVEK